jgi:CelD/BcsL family acetyltransferase involved in cellulose biosynthesis
LKSDWDELAALQQIPLLEHAWFCAAARTLHDEADLHIAVLLSERGGVDAIAPLVRSTTRHTGEGRLEALGATSLFEPTGFLYRDMPALKLLYRHLTRQGSALVVDRYWSAPEDVATVLRPRTARGHWIVRPSHGSGVLEIHKSWGMFLASLSSQRRYDYRRAERRAESLGGAHHSVIAPTGLDLAATIDRACNIEHKSWKGRQGSSLKANARLQAFVQLYAEASLDAGTLKFFFLNFGSEAAAMAICAQTDDALWFLKIGYDEKFKACSPGVLLLAQIYRYSYGAGLARIEHLGSHEPWLSPWTSFVRPYTTLMYYPFNFDGARAFSRDALQLGLSRARTLVKRWQSSP